MEKYSHEELEKIINECDVLFLPEKSSVEDALGREAAGSMAGSPNVEGKQLSDIKIPADDANEDFESIYQQAKTSKRFFVSILGSQHRPNFLHSILDPSANRFQLPRS